MAEVAGQKSTDREEVHAFDESGNPTTDPEKMWGGARTTVNETGEVTSISRFYSDAQLSKKAPEEPTKVYFD